MGFWAEFWSAFTLGIYTPKYRRINKFRAGDRVPEVYMEYRLHVGMTMDEVKQKMLPAIPYLPECNSSQLVYLYVTGSGNNYEIRKISGRLVLKFIDGKLLGDGIYIK